MTASQSRRAQQTCCGTPLSTRIVVKGRPRFEVYTTNGPIPPDEQRRTESCRKATVDEVTLRTELDGFVDDVDWHLVIAPHEFFYLGVGAALREGPPRQI